MWTLWAAVIFAVIVWLSPNSRDEYWEKLFENVIEEIEEIEENSGSVIESGETVREYLERAIIRIKQQYLIGHPVLPPFPHGRTTHQI